MKIQVLPVAATAVATTLAVLVTSASSAAAATLVALQDGTTLTMIDTDKKAVSGSVKLDNGALLAIVQEADEVFKPGDRVRILSNGQNSRVTR